MLLLLLTVAYAVCGYLTVFAIEYVDNSDAPWEGGAALGVFLVWPVSVIILAVHVMSNSNSAVSPIRLARKVRERREKSRRTIIKGKRGLEDG